MSTDDVAVCLSSELIDGGLACKLPARYGNDAVTVFFVRYRGRVSGYLNRCPHMGSELDWEGSVFTRAGDLLMCARHGATFTPDTGQCTGGPCQPSRLTALHVREAEVDGQQIVLWRPDDKIIPC
ncbi:MAG: Rieske (2Fe-2S) protein [Burkholderiaceae bacterium]|nr:Rieske (2Fe-2S) protein [Burkholderiaceae bacterium]